MCQYGGGALLDKNHLILNYTEDLLIFVTCHVGCEYPETTCDTKREQKHCKSDKF